MEQVIRNGMDTSKHVFQLHGVNAAEQPVLRKKLRRREMVEFFQKLPPVVVAIESCGGSHHWARLLQSYGHEVKLIPPQYVKPYVKRGKNDAAATSILRQIRDGRGKNVSPWLIELLKRKPPKLAAVALANKIARIAWKLMISGETYKAVVPPPVLARAA